jgi:circadian clock protein KaiC
MQFVRAAAARGEAALYITLSQTIEELREAADSHGWSLDGITLREIMPSEDALDPGEASTMFRLTQVFDQPA